MHMIEVWLVMVRILRIVSSKFICEFFFACNLQLSVECNLVLVPIFCWIEALYLNLGVFPALPPNFQRQKKRKKERKRIDVVGSFFF